MGKYDYQVTDILRGISINHNKEYNSKYTSDDTTVWELADKKAEGKENKTAVTIMLEDFTQLTNSFSDNRSCINSDNTKKGNFFTNLFAGSKKDNIFRTDEAAEAIKNNGVFYQKDIYVQEVAKNGGVKYAEEDDDIYQAALNFAKADIAAVEKAYNNAYPDRGGKKNNLESGEIATYAAESQFGRLSEILEDMDLDGKDKRISAEEYASYLIAVDGLISSGNKKSDISFSMDSVDGLVSTEEVQLASQLDTAVIKEAAAKIYKEHFA